MFIEIINIIYINNKGTDISRAGPAHIWNLNIWPLIVLLILFKSVKLFIKQKILI